MIVFKPEIKQHPDFYMRVNKCAVQPWSPRWIELCILKALNDLKIDEKSLSTLKLNDMQNVIRKNKIIKACPPAYIPLDYVERVYLRGWNLPDIDETDKQYLFEHVEVMKTSDPLKDAYLAMSRLEIDGDVNAKSLQNYSFGLDPFIQNFAIRNMWGEYRFVCSQKKIDLVISFYDKIISKRCDFVFTKKSSEEKPPEDKKSHENENKVPEKKSSLQITPAKNMIEMDVDRPECGIEYVLSITERLVTIKCWEIFQGTEKGKEEKVLIEKTDKKIDFEPVYLVIKTTETHASVNNIIICVFYCIVFFCYRLQTLI